MVSAVLVVALIFLVTYIACKYAFYKPKNFPPGPPRLPILGSYIFFLLTNHKATHKAAKFFSKFYNSKIIGFYMGDFPTIVVQSHEGVKEVLNNQAYDGRPDLLFARMREPNLQRKGIFFNDGPVWKTQRRFVLRYLRDYGFGRRFNELEIFVNDELVEFIDILKYGPKYPHEESLVRKNQVLCPYIFTAVQANSFLKIFVNERIPREDQDVLFNLGRNALIFQREGDDYGKLFSLIPWIRHIFPVKSGYKPIYESNMVIYNFIAKMVDRHIKTYNEDHIRNFIDLYIQEMKYEDEMSEDNTFSRDQFILGIVDFIFPVLSALSVQMSFFFQWLLLRPDVQEKIHTELDEIVGKGRLPSLNDRQYLHYTEASIREVLRIETLVPSNLPHKTLDDTKLLGYDIPKGTFVLTALQAFHNDEDLWVDPDNFRPERFLDENGHLCLKKDITLPFGAGKRLCAGETFARNMLFLTITAVCHNFKIVPGPDGKLPDRNKTQFGLISTPPNFWLNLVPR